MAVIAIIITPNAQAAPVVPGLNAGANDLLGESFNPADLLSFLFRLLFSEGGSRSRDNINPLELLSFAQNFLGSLTQNSNESRDEVVQDPRVLNYDQEINRRNQLSRLARVVTGFLFR